MRIASVTVLLVNADSAAFNQAASICARTLCTLSVFMKFHARVDGRFAKRYVGRYSRFSTDHADIASGPCVSACTHQIQIRLNTLYRFGEAVSIGEP
jgi:hypothetical protein